MDENEPVEEEGKALDQFTFRPGKSTAHGVWQSVLGLVQMKRMRGKFWTKAGFTVNGVDFLYPEEALSLYERKLLSIDWQDGRLMNKKELFDVALGVIPLAVYLVYAKLKALDYIILRHNKSVRVFGGDHDVKAYLSSHPTHSLLDSMVSYALYIDAQKFSKKAAKTMQPLHYVVIVDGANVLNPRLTRQLLTEAKGVSVIFAVVTSTLNVILEEFVDANEVFKVENINDNARVTRKEQRKKDKQDKKRNRQQNHMASIDKSAERSVDEVAAADEEVDHHADTSVDVDRSVDMGAEESMNASLDLLLEMALEMDMDTDTDSALGSKRRKTDEEMLQGEESHESGDMDEAAGENVDIGIVRADYAGDNEVDSRGGMDEVTNAEDDGKVV